jgi:hypothetical protein
MRSLLNDDLPAGRWSSPVGIVRGRKTKRRKEMSEKLKQLEQEAEARARRLAEEFAGKIGSLKNKIIDLESKKKAIEHGKISIAEAVQRMKEDRRAGLKWIVDEFVKANLNSYVSQFRSLQNWESLRSHQLQALEWVRFLYTWITDDMIDEAAKKLDGGGGLDSKQREAKIKELDRQIQEAEREMEGLLK